MLRKTCIYFLPGYLEYEQNNGNVKGELRDKKANVIKLRNQKYEDDPPLVGSSQGRGGI